MNRFPLPFSPACVFGPFVLGLFVLAAAGCLNLSPQESQTQYYVLGSEVESRTAPVDGAADGPSIALRPVRLASYLDTPALVTRFGPNRVQFAEFNRWGEELGRAINRTVLGYIAGHMPVERIDTVPLPSGATYDYLLQLRVLRFEGDATGAAPSEDPTAAQPGAIHMFATWEIIDPASGSVLRRGTTDHRAEGWTVGDYADLVNRLDSALEILARDVVAGLEAVRG